MLHACVLLGMVLGAGFPPVDELPEQEGLPDVFSMMDGREVTSKAMWVAERRPEILGLFAHYVYGVAPKAPEIVVTEDAPERLILEGRASVKQLRIGFVGLPEGAPAIHLALFLPRPSTGPVPVFLGLNKCGNHTAVDSEAMLIKENAWFHSYCKDDPEANRGLKKDFWCVDYLVSRGYGLATFHESDIDPDQDDFTDGIHAAYGDFGAPKGSEWGTIAAWAWGLQRGVDYLVTDPDVDRTKIALIGHSRRGKAALWAGANDERVALVVPHQSGTGGMALSRDNEQETVKRINDHFPHWFCDTFAAFNDRESLLPVDQHLLMACVAPRLLLDTAGLQDTWANYESAYKGLRAAAGVWRFMEGMEIGMRGDGMVVGPEEPVVGPDFGEVMQYRLDTKHDLNADYWRGILDFADAHFEK